MHYIFLLVILLLFIQETSTSELQDYILGIYNDLQVIQNCAEDDLNILEFLERRFEDHAKLIAAIVGIMHESNTQLMPYLQEDFMDVLVGVQKLLETLHECLVQYHTLPQRYYPIIERTGGRPRYVIPHDQICQLGETGMSWRAIATLSVSERTLRRHRLRIGLPRDRYTSHPESGETYVQGSLRGKYKIWRVRERLQIIDPVGRAVRQRRAIRQRTYNITVPNQLWHMDSIHKLISWWFVIHGCIDGASRCIIYLKCLANNLAQTVLGYFQEDVRAFGMPSWVRADKGVENIYVAHFVINMKGVGRRSFKTGLSVHNQRIERLWAETNRVLSRYYRRLFMFMEDLGLLSNLDEVDLFVLHFVFLPQIQRSLDEFYNQWNYHGLSSVGHQSPLALWMQDALLHLDNTGHDAINMEPFSVPFINALLTPDALNHLQTLCDLLSDDGNHGINHFLIVKSVVTQLLGSL
ncbi:hypothetical protein ACJMK2_015716 [Sinanodonta woodiana]|uniref:Integrase catalytic domain-containing protein n=1 Tax=Sinanodonta woodiana TaxID=1069815 RepID=A0ABD3US82_SINWO